MPLIENYDLRPDEFRALVAAIRENLNNPPPAWSEHWFYHDGSHTPLVDVTGGKIFLWADEEPHAGSVIAACRFGPRPPAPHLERDEQP